MTGPATEDLKVSALPLGSIVTIDDGVAALIVSCSSSPAIVAAVTVTGVSTTAVNEPPTKTGCRLTSMLMEPFRLTSHEFVTVYSTVPKPLLPAAGVKITVPGDAPLVT